jgi:hypothetical protein
MPLPLAILIDGENVDPALFIPMQEFIAAFGDPIAWQLHGDLLPWKVQWLDLAEQHGLEVRQTFSGGKNSADIAMTIAAMDILAAGRVGGFCLVSSDSDFAPLARRLRASNMAVFGLGEAKTAEAFRKACTEFHELRQPLATEKAMTALKVVASREVLLKPAKPPFAKKQTVPAVPKLDGISIELVRERLRTACREHGTGGWLAMPTAAQQLKNHLPEVFAKIGGTGKLLKNLEALALVNVQGKGTQRSISVRKPERPALHVVG